MQGNARRAAGSLLLAAIFATACQSAPAVAGDNDREGDWVQLASLPIRVQEIYPAFHRGRIYVAGGLSPDVATPNNVSDRTLIYDPASDAWSEGPRLPEPRHHPYLLSDGNGLFAIGGFVAAGGGIWSASTDILRLDEDAQRWVRVASLLHPQSETVAAAIDGLVYIASGRMPTGTRNAEWNDQGDIARLQIFDPARLEVVQGPDAPSARNSAAGAVIDGRLFVAGGRVVGGSNESTLESFDPRSGNWERLSPMPNAQGGIAAAAVDGRLYVFGGEYFGASGSGVHRESWAYDPATDAWSRISPMPVPRHGLGAVAIDGSIYVIGGATQASGQGTSDRLSRFTP